jgi:hypothetical protein
VPGRSTRALADVKSLRAVFLVASLSACVPMQETYYRPSGAGSRRMDTPCDGVPSTMDFSVAAGINANVNAYVSTSGSFEGIITFDGVESASLRRAPDTVVVVDTSTESSPRKIPVTVKTSWGNHGKHLFVNISSPVAPERSFSVQVPSLDLDGHTTESPLAKYERTKTVVWKALCM